MEKTNHRFHDLFAQLGLPSDDASIQRFVAAHSPLPPTLKLHQAPFWSNAQACALLEMIQQDADWAEVADQLDLALRMTPSN
ncbi:MAG: hypothetical protein RJA34_1160 [Pseudomonadota bacterium]|jgi:hypothetical protein